MIDTDLDAMLDQRHPPARECRVCWALRGVPAETRAKFEQVLATSAPATGVAAAFVARDWPVSAESITRHRRRCAD